MLLTCLSLITLSNSTSSKCPSALALSKLLEPGLPTEGGRHNYFGAVVDVDIPCLTGSEAKHFLNDAFSRYGLLLFRNQQLTPKQELDFMQLLPFDATNPGAGPVG